MSACAHFGLSEMRIESTTAEQRRGEVILAHDLKIPEMGTVYTRLEVLSIDNFDFMNSGIRCGAYRHNENISKLQN